ncbi:MAG: polyketide cyclase [Nitrosopumilales archaeon CG_4_9_14_0_2_um_filter_34_16]|nr:MAG: polyketide cyclase [Nitrosopumilales archaeon CG_4_9_14_0_2_um_filter_34_16]
MPQFSLQRTINAKRELVFDIFSNFENYQKLLPQHFPSVRVRSIRNNVAVVEEYLNLGNKELLIMAKHVSDNPVSHEVFVIGGDIKGSYFKQQFIEFENTTKVIFDIDLKLKGKSLVSSMLKKNNYEQDYSKILDDFVKIIEN